MKPGKLLADRIRTLREAVGLSQQEVAMEADLSLSLVAKLEQGKKADPRASTLLALAGALDVPPGDLLNNLFAEQTEPQAAESESEPGEGKKKHKKKGKKKAKS